MVRIACIADSHFDEHSRFDECVRLHDVFAEECRRRGVDLILHGGDVYERANSSRMERKAVVDWVRKLAGIAPVVVVRGNHDGAGELGILGKLRTQHPVIVEEACGVHLVAGVAVGCVAWPRKAELLARLQAENAGVHASGEAATVALQNVLRGLSLTMSGHRGPRILLMHAMVSGSMTSTGQPLVGCDLEVSLSDLVASQAHAIALGHIHKGQDWDFAGVPIFYPGSPRRTAFGEVEEKGFIIIECEDNALRWERVALPATPMLLLESVWEGDRLSDWQINEKDARGAEIRFRYSVTRDYRDAARTQAECVQNQLLALGAMHVKLEEILIASTRARAPEVARAMSIEEKLEALWLSRGDAISEERKQRLFAKLRALGEAA